MNVACVFVISTVRPIRGRALGRSFGREPQEVMEVWPGTPPDYERFCKPLILAALFFPDSPETALKRPANENRLRRIPSVSHRPLGPLLDEEQCAASFQASGHSGQCEGSAGSAADADCGRLDKAAVFLSVREPHREQNDLESRRETDRTGTEITTQHHRHGQTQKSWTEFRKSEESVS